MKAITNNHNLRLLNAEELKEISGGSSDNSSGSISMSSSTDSLLSIQMEWQQGDHYRMYKVEAGNGINLDLNAWGSGTGSKA